MRKAIVYILLLCGCCAGVCAQTASPMYTLTIGGHTAQVELALTHEERSKGLMFRESLDEDSGMLFVFDRSGFYSFWMRNTFIPLSIAFIDARGIIVNIEEMVPHDERPVSPELPIIYVLEMNAGWFSGREIMPGMRVDFDEKILERLKKKN